MLPFIIVLPSRTLYLFKANLLLYTYIRFKTNAFIRIIKMMQFQLKLIIILLSICKLITIVHAKAPGHLQPVLDVTHGAHKTNRYDWCTEKEILLLANQ